MVPNHPVVGVSWYEAVAYCNWLKATTGRYFRLPDEAMWEKAARGTDGRIYSWGNEWNVANLNANETGIGQTSAVGMFPNSCSLFGIYDVCGGVWDWCSSIGYSKSNYPFQQIPYEQDLYVRDSRILRGGAFSGGSRNMRTAYRGYYSPSVRTKDFGFRVAEYL